MRQFAEHGYGGASVRAIATRAGVSPALVLHHYGSKDGLRRACDERLMEVTADKEGIMRGGSVPSVAQYLAEHPEATAVLAYLRRVMSDGGALGSELFQRLHTETIRLLRLGQQAGTVREVADLEAAAAILTAWSLGVLMMSDDLGRALGSDTVFDLPASDRYSRTGTDMLTHGVLDLAPPTDNPAPPRTTETATEKGDRR